MDLYQGKRSEIKCYLTCFLMLQVLWEMLTREIPFKGMEGVQVAWFVVTKEEVCVKSHISYYIES